MARDLGDALVEALAPMVRYLAENMPRIEAAVTAYEDGVVAEELPGIYRLEALANGLLDGGP